MIVEVFVKDPVSVIDGENVGVNPVVVKVGVAEQRLLSQLDIFFPKLLL